MNKKNRAPALSTFAMAVLSALPAARAEQAVEEAQLPMKRRHFATQRGSASHCAHGGPG